MHSPARFVLPVFEGPLDLLLHLVKINEMEIADIQISVIAAQYLEYLAAMQEIDLEVAGEFLVMAATLLNIKSRSLLPRLPDGEGTGIDEEEIDEILSTQDLIRRLVEYRKVKEISHKLRELEAEAARIFHRVDVVPVIPGAPEGLPPQDILALFDAFARVLAQLKFKPEHRVAAEVFTVEDKLEEVREKLKRERVVNFTRVLQSCVARAEAVCYFLALLELARMREITLAQAGSFEDILIAPWDDLEPAVVE